MISTGICPSSRGQGRSLPEIFAGGLEIPNNQESIARYDGDFCLEVEVMVRLGGEGVEGKPSPLS